MKKGKTEEKQNKNRKKKEKRERKQELREIREILLGRTELEEDGMLSAVPSGQVHLFQGVSDGAWGVRIFGVAHRKLSLKTDLSRENATAAVRKIMQDLGRGLLLRETPEAAACLIRYVLTKPAVLVFRNTDTGPVVSAWAGRGLMGTISRRRALAAFARHLPEEITPRQQEERPSAAQQAAAEKKEDDAV